MKVAADFSQRVVVHSALLDWVASPMPGVERRLLDRVGGEVARATSIVRYAPGSVFSAHVHTGGEEFIVLDGVFQDEHGSFPTGSYIRNPPGSKHTPGSDVGCVMLVKLWQFQESDNKHVRLQTDLMENIAHPTINGVSVNALHTDDFEEVSLLHFDANTEMRIPVKGGVELLVLSGTLVEQSDTLVKHSWLRLPVDSELSVTSGDKGATVWCKQGHLTDVHNQITRVENA